VPECPICRRTYDDRFKVFAPPHSEAFDTIECARFAAAAGASKAQYTPVILPTIEALRPPGDRRAAAPRVGVAAAAIPAAQFALAGGVGLLAAGTAAAVYLAAQPPSKLRHATTIAAGLPTPTKTADATSGPKGSGERRPPLTHHPRLRNPARQTPSSIAAIADADAPGRSRSGGGAVAQLASRVIPTASSLSPAASSTQAPSPEPAATRQSPRPPTHRSPRPTTHRSPRPASPPSPTPAPDPVAPTAPTVVAAPASLEAPGSSEQAHQTRPKPQPSPGGNPPSTTPPPTTPPPTTPSPSTEPPPTTSTSETRPGNGYGDRNHEHTGPPGQSSGDSGSSSTTGSGGSESSGNDHGNGQGNNSGHGNGNGNGGGHGHGHGG
jgi:hypothetical protein